MQTRHSGCEVRAEHSVRAEVEGVPASVVYENDVAAVCGVVEGREAPAFHDLRFAAAGSGLRGVCGGEFGGAEDRRVVHVGVGLLREEVTLYQVDASVDYPERLEW